MKNEILKKDKHVLQSLAYCAGFDFQKPFGILKGVGSFTQQGIKKKTGITNLNLYNCVVLCEGNSVTPRHFTAVKLTKKGFEQFGSRETAYTSLDHYMTVYAFEQVRKAQNKIYYVVFQNIQYKRRVCQSTKLDINERMICLKRTSCHYPKEELCSFTSGSFLQYGKVIALGVGSAYYKEALTNPLDKSGYWILGHQTELKSRLRDYKASKRAEAAKAIDDTELFDLVKSKVCRAREVVSQRVLRSPDLTVVTEEVRQLAHCSRRLKSYEEKRNNQSFTSPETRLKSLRELNEELDIIIAVKEI